MHAAPTVSAVQVNERGHTAAIGLHDGTQRNVPPPTSAHREASMQSASVVHALHHAVVPGIASIAASVAASIAIGVSPPASPGLLPSSPHARSETISASAILLIHPPSEYKWTT